MGYETVMDRPSFGVWICFSKHADVQIRARTFSRQSDLLEPTELALENLPVSA